MKKRISLSLLWISAKPTWLKTYTDRIQLKLSTYELPRWAVFNNNMTTSDGAFSLNAGDYCSIPGRYRHTSLKRVVTGRLPSARQHELCYWSTEMTIIDGCPRSKYVWHVQWPWVPSTKSTFLVKANVVIFKIRFLNPPKINKLMLRLLMQLKYHKRTDRQINISDEKNTPF